MEKSNVEKALHTLTAVLENGYLEVHVPEINKNIRLYVNGKNERVESPAGWVNEVGGRIKIAQGYLERDCQRMSSSDNSEGFSQG